LNINGKDNATLVVEIAKISKILAKIGIREVRLF